MLGKVLGVTKNPTDEKLSPNWEGPYGIISQVGVGVYQLKTIKDKDYKLKRIKYLN